MKWLCCIWFVLTRRTHYRWFEAHSSTWSKVITQKLLVTSDDVRWPEMHVQRSMVKISLKWDAEAYLWVYWIYWLANKDCWDLFYWLKREILSCLNILAYSCRCILAVLVYLSKCLWKKKSSPNTVRCSAGVGAAAGYQPHIWQCACNKKKVTTKLQITYYMHKKNK